MTASSLVSPALASNQSDRVSKNKSAQSRGCPPPPGHGNVSKFHHKRAFALEKMNASAHFLHLLPHFILIIINKNLILELEIMLRSYLCLIVRPFK